MRFIFFFSCWHVRGAKLFNSIFSFKYDQTFSLVPFMHPAFFSYFHKHIYNKRIPRRRCRGLASAFKLGSTGSPPTLETCQTLDDIFKLPPLQKKLLTVSFNLLCSKLTRSELPFKWLKTSIFFFRLPFR